MQMFYEGMIYRSIFIHLCLISNCILLAISSVVGKLKSMSCCRPIYSAIALPVCRCSCLFVEINIIFFEKNGKINALQKKNLDKKHQLWAHLLWSSSEDINIQNKSKFGRKLENSAFCRLVIYFFLYFLAWHRPLPACVILLLRHTVHFL